MTFCSLDFPFEKSMHPCFYAKKVFAFYDCLRFCMFFLEIEKKEAMFFAVVLDFTIFAHPTIGGPPPRAHKESIYTQLILFQTLRGCKKMNLTICRKNRDLILGSTTRSIPSGM